ncbi:hypothetical protein EON82_16550 [bacterium]|nr:MAG: hypothetical protein EON82_16550 [bacterium]
MTTIPTWWLILSAIFFVANIFLYIALGLAALKLASVVKDLSPRIVAIEKQIQELVKKVSELATNLNHTVSSVGGRAKGVVGSAEGIAQSASRQFERFSPFVVGALTAIRLVKALNESKKGRSLAKATSRKGIAKKPAGLVQKIWYRVRGG